MKNWLDYRFYNYCHIFKKSCPKILANLINNRQIFMNFSWHSMGPLLRWSPGFLDHVIAPFPLFFLIPRSVTQFSQINCVIIWRLEHRGSIPGWHFPLSTLRSPSYDDKRMTRGRCDSLIFLRMKLSFTTSRRFHRRTNDGVNTH